MNKVITIDGPSASGKGTLAILLADSLNWKILDSGALYRAFAYFSISENDQRLIEQNLRKISFNIVDNSIQVLFENEDISRHLRTEETAIQASKISSLHQQEKYFFQFKDSFQKQVILLQMEEIWEV
jgi:cytidylate kinase